MDILQHLERSRKFPGAMRRNMFYWRKYYRILMIEKVFMSSISNTSIFSNNIYVDVNNIKALNKKYLV